MDFVIENIKAVENKIRRTLIILGMNFFTLMLFFLL